MDLTTAAFYFLGMMWVLIYSLEKGYFLGKLADAMRFACLFSLLASIICAALSLITK